MLLILSGAQYAWAKAGDVQTEAGLVALKITGEPSGGSYVDPSQLNVPWPKFSFFKVPWRGYLETVPGTTFRDGLGVVWSQSPRGMSADTMAGELEAAGFRRVRIEIPWSDLAWSEKDFTASAKRELTADLLAFKAHHLRPLILLNANSGVPGPVRNQRFTVFQGAPAGAREIRLNGYLGNLKPWHAELMIRGRGVKPLLTSINPTTGIVTLSAPLFKPLTKGDQVRIMTSKYVPLYPVGTPQFKNTAAGWRHYVQLVSDFVVRTYGCDKFDVEIWNEMSFGSAFTSINNYIRPKPKGTGVDLLRPGGRAWTIAKQTVDLLNERHPDVKVIWGFSNTSFFHTPIKQLPPGIDGQSYHPYGTGKRCFQKIAAAMSPWRNLDGVVPDFCAVQPEGWAQTFQQTESLMRLLRPDRRLLDHPPGTTHFVHFMTEDGFVPKGIGITYANAALEAKAKFALRVTLFWLNKGISAIYLYHAWDGNDLGMGFLRADGHESPATLALGRLAAQFSDAKPLMKVRQLKIDLAALGPEHVIFAGPSGTPVLRDRDVVAILPFELTLHKFIIAVYVESEDFPKDHVPEPYQISIGGVNGAKANVRYYDPLGNHQNVVVITKRKIDELVVRLWATDVPSLLEIDD